MRLWKYEINMHHNSIAHQLLAQHAAKVKADLMLFSEQYRTESGFMASRLTASRCYLGSAFDFMFLPREWFCLGSMFRDNVFTVYLTPNETMPDFRHRLDALEHEVAVSGHFNASALKWGMPHPDRR